MSEARETPLRAISGLPPGLNRIESEWLREMVNAASIDGRSRGQRHNFEASCQRSLSYAAGVFLFEGNLRQHRSGDVGAGLRVIDEKILASFHHHPLRSPNGTAIFQLGGWS
jgi:hypothetical protein